MATAEGRLTFGELTERTEAAYTATTRGQLVPITADLPEVSSAPAAPVRAADRGDREWVAAVMGDVKVYVPDGVDVQLRGVAVMGDKKLMVREAPAGQPSPRVLVKATAVMGDVKVIGDSYAEPVRRRLRAWLTRDDPDRRAIE